MGFFIKKTSMKTIDEKINELKSEGYDFSISNIISDSFDLYKLHLGLFVGFFVVYFIGAAIVSAIAGLIPYGIGRIAFQVGVAPMSLGAFYVLHRIKNNREFSFENFFDGYKDFTKIIIYTLLNFLIILPALSLVIIYIIYKVYQGFDFVRAFSDPQTMQELIMSGEFFKMYAIIILLALPALYVSFCFQFVSFLVLFLNVDYSNAFKWSFSIVNKRIFKLIACHFVLGIIALSGIILCGIGIIFTIPIIYFGQYLLFYHIFDISNLDHPMRDKIHDYLEVDKDEMFR